MMPPPMAPREARRHARPHGRFDFPLVGAALSATVVACASHVPAEGLWPSARLGYQRVGPYAAFFVAEKKGFFRDERVRVESIEYPSSNVMGQAQLAGQIDGSGFMSFPVVFAMEQQVPGQSVCYLVLPMSARSRFSAVVVGNGSKVARPEDLRGVTIGVYPSSTNVVYARLMLQRLFGSADVARLVQVEPTNQMELLASGAVDVLIGPDPMPAIAVARHAGHVLVYSPDAQYVMDPLPVGCASSSRAFEARQPEAARRVRRAMERAVDYLREPSHRDEVRAIVGERTGIDAAVAQQLGEVDYWKVPEADRLSLQRLADLLQREGVLTSHVDTAPLLAAP